MRIIFIKSTYFKRKKKFQSQIAREIAKLGAKTFYNIENPRIKETKTVPTFENAKIKFSISHSNELIAVCFSENNIGLDVEYMKERNFINLSEYLNLPQNTEKITFYQIWTKYEAQYKSNNPNIESFIIDNYMFSVSFSEEINNKLKIYEVKIPIDKTNPIELINLKLAKDNNTNENTVDIQEINVAELEFLPQSNLKIE